MAARVEHQGRVPRTWPRPGSGRWLGFVVLLAGAVWLSLLAAAVVAEPAPVRVVAPGGGPGVMNAPTDIRLMTYNIRWGKGADGRVDLARVASVLREASPDIAVLNEVDVNRRRSGYIDQPAVLMRAAGYPYGAFVPSFRGPNALGGVSEYGNMIVSRFPIEGVSRVSLPGPRLSEPRSLLVADVRVGPLLLTVMGTHLGLRREERLEQVARILEVAAARSGPMVLLGDFNARPDGPEIARLTGEGAREPLWFDAHRVAGEGEGNTFPSSDPVARIDYVFVSRDLAPYVVAGRPWPSVASDHLPVTAVLRYPGPAVPGPEQR